MAPPSPLNSPTYFSEQDRLFAAEASRAHLGSRSDSNEELA